MRFVGKLISAGLWCLEGAFGVYRGMAAIRRRVYRPERYYMRGPGPKSQPKFEAESNA